MPLIPSNYEAPLWIRGKHTETIFPALFRKVKGIKYQRERVDTSDGDFIDIDWSRKKHKRLVILSHGLEGSSNARYVLGMVKILNKEGWDTLSWNYRSCSGENNKLLTSYHAGSTDDLGFVIDHALQQPQNYEEIVLIGFSLGGNMTLKYLGEKKKNLPSQIVKAIAFSVPCDLHGCVDELTKTSNRVYLNDFLVTLKKKTQEKAALFPDMIDEAKIKKIETFPDFDNLVTAPHFGFRNAEDYYEKCSAKQAIPDITIPTLIINAQNDPFLNADCYPVEECLKSSCVYLESPLHGGHLGFINDQLNKPFWSDLRALEFLKS